MLKTNKVTQRAAPQRRNTTIFSPGRPRQRGDAMKALPRPMPSINDISTMANDCKEEPKMRESEREASTSNPIEINPVNATVAPAHRSVPAAGGTSVFDSFGATVGWSGK